MTTDFENKIVFFDSKKSTKLMIFVLKSSWQVIELWGSKIFVQSLTHKLSQQLSKSVRQFTAGAKLSTRPKFFYRFSAFWRLIREDGRFRVNFKGLSKPHWFNQIQKLRQKSIFMPKLSMNMQPTSYRQK